MDDFQKVPYHVLLAHARRHNVRCSSGITKPHLITRVQEHVATLSPENRAAFDADLELGVRTHKLSLKTQSPRGFAAMQPYQVSEIASLGGKTAWDRGRAHRWTPEEAKAANEKARAAREANRANRQVHR